MRWLLSRRFCSSISRSDPSSGAPSSPFFNRVCIANNIVYVSGTGAGNDIGAQGQGPPRLGTAAEETRWSLANVKQILEASGSSMDHVVSVTMLLTNKEDYSECNEEYVKHFPNGLPTRSTALWGVPTQAKVAFSCIAVAAGPVGRP